MFLRSSVSAFGRCAKKCRIGPRLRIHTNGALCSEVKKSEVDFTKSVNVIFNKPDGSVVKEVAYVNERVYDVIQRVDENGLVFPGFGECKGVTTCSTCHVILDEKDFNKFESTLEDEQDMLDTVLGASDFSRLGCRIHITEDMEGMVFNIPAFTNDIRS